MTTETTTRADHALSSPTFRVGPYRFTERPDELRRFLEAVGLRTVVGRDGWAVLRGAGGTIGVHPLATAESSDHVATGFGLETDDARTAAEALEAEGLQTRWWDESWGRQAAIRGPDGEITVNEPMHDTYGYDPAPDPRSGDEPRVEVMELLFTTDLDAWAAFFARLGFAPSSDPAGVADAGWRELRAGEGSGAIGLHLAGEIPRSPDASALSFATAEPLAEFADRMRGLGYRVDDVPDARAPHVEILDPDGERIEVHHRPAS